MFKIKRPSACKFCLYAKNQRLFFRAMITFITVGGRTRKGHSRLRRVLGEFFGEIANPIA
jgi:hypothetical protein